MTAYTVAAKKIGAHAKTLTGSTVDTVTFAEDLPAVTIITSGSAAIFYTVDGSTPTVNGDNCYLIPAAAGRETRTVTGSGPTVVKLISSGTPTYSVQRG